MKVLWSILVLHVLMVNSLLDFELIFSLREYFSSNVVLIALKENKVELAKRLFKYRSSSPKAFLGVINIDKYIDDFIPRSQISKFHNIIIASDCGEFLELLQLQVDLPHLLANLVFVLFEQKDISAQLKNLYIPFNSRFFLIKKNYEIFDIYQITANDSKIYTHFSFWDTKEFETSIENFYTRRMDLKGHLIHMMYTSEQDYTQYWRLFSEIMNFTMDWVPVVYGGIFPNGTKYGLVKMLDEHVIDGTHHNYKFTHHRADYFDYIFPAYIAETKIYVALNEEINWASFMSPFTTEVWLSIFVWIVIASIIMLILNEYSNNNNPEYSFFNVIKAMLYQSGTIYNTNISFYIAYLMSYILGLVIMQEYSGVFLSYLTVKKLTLPFENLKEIIRIGSHKILLENDSYTLYHFKTEEDEESVNIRSNLLVSDSEMLAWEDKQSGFQQICQKKLVFITGTSDYTINGECDIASLKEILFLDVEGILIRKGYPFKDIFNALMKKIQLVGLLRLKRKNFKAPYDSSHFIPLAFNSVLSIFSLLIFFIIFSLLIFCCERYFSLNSLENQYHGWKK